MALLSFSETKKIFLKYKLPILSAELFESEKEALISAKKIGFPVVLKIWSSNILHRTDIGGVKVGINNEKDFKQAFFNLQKIKNVEGIIVQKMGEGKQLFLGMKRDGQFGPVIAFGLGGIFVEVLKDVSFRVCPVSRSEAQKMIKEIKGFPILKGQRGQDGINIEALINLILKISKLSLEENQIKEIDFNPVIADAKKILLADFKIII
ncbi:MAG: acetate--CoA ligase family protein [Patescibacteria group bacterium]